MGHVLVFGGCGFLGSNITDALLSDGMTCTVYDNLGRHGSVDNLNWLRSSHAFNYCHGDIRSQYDCEEAVKDCQPDVIINFAGQVAMTTSISSPRLDFETNAMGTFNVLEAARLYAPDAQILFSSTNKVYGDLEWITYEETDSRYIAKGYEQGFSEDTPLDFRSPYGCSKGAAEQYILDYHRVFGLNTAVFRHSSMYGGRQFATADQGWVGWFCSQYADPAVTEISISGNGKQVRDLLHANDMRTLYQAAIEKKDKISGQVFNIGGGSDRNLSLLELFDLLSSMSNRRLPVNCNSPRQSDQKVFVANIAKASEMLGWVPKVSASEGVRDALAWAREKYSSTNR